MLMQGFFRRRLTFLLIVSLVVVPLFAAACSRHVTSVDLAYGERVTPPDLVLINGKVVTVDDNLPEAEAVAIRGDVIVAVGSNSEIEPYIGQETKVIDLNSRLVIPGFIEGHAHFISLGYFKMQLDLSTARSWDGIVAMVQEAARKVQPGEWILGRGWHQEKWDKIPAQAIQGYPTHHALSNVSPQNPVMLTHASGHAIIANARAMELAGITQSTADPPGGKILRFADGSPTGIFTENAEELIKKALEEDRGTLTRKQIEQEKRKAIALAAEECLRKGITSFQDAGSTFEDIDLFKKLVEEGELPIRLWVMIDEGNEPLRKHLLDYRIIKLADDRLTVRAIKLSMDGALGSRGAWLLEPYSDLPTSTGLNTMSLDSLEETAQLAIENDFQLCTHAIGDRANREVLNVYERVFNEQLEKRDLRWRIEHAQHIASSDITRFSELSVIAAMQAVHCTSDGPWVPKRIGQRRAAEGAYVWQKLMKSGAILANGTDAPVENVDPLANFYAAVTRRLPDGTVFYPDQRMTTEEALKSYTINCAYAAFEEDVKGSITVGKLADIVVLSKDIMTVPDEEILDSKVLYTIVGGEIVYQQ